MSSWANHLMDLSGTLHLAGEDSVLLEWCDDLGTPPMDCAALLGWAELESSGTHATRWHARRSMVPILCTQDYT